MKCINTYQLKVYPLFLQTRDYINEELLKEFPIGKIDKCSGLCRPVSYETTHQWMKCCDCKYKAVQKTYYNDTHERHDNQLDRVNKTCRHAFTALREEKWYCVSPEEKKRLESKYAVWPSDVHESQSIMLVPTHLVVVLPITKMQKRMLNLRGNGRYMHA